MDSRDLHKHLSFASWTHSGQLSLLPSVGPEMSGSLRATG